MATKLSDDQTLRRLVKVYGVEGDVEFSLSAEGIAFRIPGSRTYVTLDWPHVVEACQTPKSVKCYHYGKPLEFLKATALKVRAKHADESGTAEETTDGN